MNRMPLTTKATGHVSRGFCFLLSNLLFIMM